MRCCILSTQVTGVPSMKHNIYSVVLVMHYLIWTVLHTVIRVYDFKKESLDCKRVFMYILFFFFKIFLSRQTIALKEVTLLKVISLVLVLRNTEDFVYFWVWSFLRIVAQIFFLACGICYSWNLKMYIFPPYEM